MSHIDRFIETAIQRIYFPGKHVLEIGCGNGEMLRKIAENCHPAFITGIDLYLDSWWSATASAGPNWEVKQGDASQMEFPDNSFDAVISVATFEHITRLRETLAEIKRVLKPGGVFLTEFAPIWTSIIGHHYNFWVYEEVDLIPPWGHLWMTEDEMRIYLAGKVGSGKAEEACQFIYHGEMINRVGRDEFYDLLKQSGMWIRELVEYPSFSRYHYYGNDASELTEEILRKLTGKYRLEELAVDGFKIMLQKY
jgi:ubiquinone/menaquinone biosynthesis C-methylase UbiE